MTDSQLPCSAASEERKTFTVPPGYEAVRDAEGRATGKVRKIAADHAQPVVWRVRYCGQWMYFENKANAEIYAQGDDNTEPLYASQPSPTAEPPRDLGLCDRVKCACACREALAKEVERLTRARSAPAAAAETTVERIAQEFYNRMGPHEMVSREEARDMLRAIEPPARCSAGIEAVKTCNSYLERALEAEAKVKSLENIVDLLESNARVQAKLLADTGRERDQLRAVPQGAGK